jgi:hypothetical protein
MGIDFKKRKAPAYQIGDLVTFCGYNYSPEYMYASPPDKSLGIVINSTIRPSTLKEYFTYKVFWFKSLRFTEAIGAHLKLISP